MPVPDFVLRLREKIGTDPLWLVAVTAVVLDDTGSRVLLIRRSDTGEWAPITGIIDPGEQPAAAAVREAAEEANVVITVERVAGVGVSDRVLYANGDRAQYVDVSFTCRWVSGEARPADGEALEVRWFPVDDLPEMTDDFRNRIAQGRATGAAAFTIAAAPDAW